MKKQPQKSTPQKIIYDVFTPPQSVKLSKLRDLHLYALENGKIIAIEFHPTQSRRSSQLRKIFAASELINGNLKEAKTQLREYFLKKRSKFAIPMELYGTPFQLSVWKALLKIPYGKIASYKQIATKISGLATAKAVNPLTSRSVGTAVGTNPISIVIPCHRILRLASSDKGYRVGQYGGGIPTKKLLLALEDAMQHNPIIA